MNFYTGPMRFLPPVLVAPPARLPCGSTGAATDILSTRSSRAAEGGAFQRASEGIEDNRIAAGWLASAVSRILSSSGTATAACSPCATPPIIRKRRRLVLLSAHVAQGHRPEGSAKRSHGGRARRGFAAAAREMVKARRGRE